MVLERTFRGSSARANKRSIRFQGLKPPFKASTGVGLPRGRIAGGRLSSFPRFDKSRWWASRRVRLSSTHVSLAYPLGTQARSRIVFVGREVLKTARTGIPIRGLPSFR